MTVVQLDGRSIVTQQYSQAPLQLHRPLYLDGEDFPTVYLKTPSAGLLGGDKHQFKLYAGRGSTIKILNQSATLVYPGASAQEIEIYIESGATVFFEPCPLIFAKGAIFQQNVNVTMQEGSRLRYIDEWSAGRIAMNECWQFERFDNMIEIWFAGALKYRERFVLEPLKNKPDHNLICRHYSRFKSLYQIGSWDQSESDSAPAIKIDGEGGEKEGTQKENIEHDVFAGAMQKSESSLHSADQNYLSWRLERPNATIDRILSAPSSAQPGRD